MRFELCDGRIQTFSLETHLVDHCNLRCAGCCQLSPFMPEGFLEPERLRDDLARAAQALRPQVFKFTGGEPLLHPQIAACLRIARESGIAPVVQITTNGLRLAEAPEELFQNVDRIKVSRYPSAPLSDRALETIALRCRRAGVELAVREYPAFQHLDRQIPSLPGETRSVFASCWIRVRCHLLYRGRFFTCSRPAKLEAFLHRQGRAEALVDADGVDLDAPRLRERILAELEREEPLESCRHCLGSTGPWSPHRQLSAVELRGTSG